jgi:hypothetical protein
MLEHLQGPESVEPREMFGRLIPITTHPAKRMTDRKARLFAVACCRQLSDLYDETHCQRLIDYGLECDVFEGRRLVVPAGEKGTFRFILVRRSCGKTLAMINLNVPFSLAFSLDTNPACGSAYLHGDHAPRLFTRRTIPFLTVVSRRSSADRES